MGTVWYLSTCIKRKLLKSGTWHFHFAVFSFMSRADQILPALHREYVIMNYGYPPCHGN